MVWKGWKSYGFDRHMLDWVTQKYTPLKVHVGVCVGHVDTTANHMGLCEVYFLECGILKVFNSFLRTHSGRFMCEVHCGNDAKCHSRDSRPWSAVSRWPHVAAAQSTPPLSLSKHHSMAGKWYGWPEIRIIEPNKGSRLLIEFVLFNTRNLSPLFLVSSIASRAYIARDLMVMIVEVGDFIILSSNGLPNIIELEGWS